MQRAGDDLLADAAVAGDEHGHVSVRHLPNELPNRAHRGRRGHEAVIRLGLGGKQAGDGKIQLVRQVGTRDDGDACLVGDSEPLVVIDQYDRQRCPNAAGACDHVAQFVRGDPAGNQKVGLVAAAQNFVHLAAACGRDDVESRPHERCAHLAAANVHIEQQNAFRVGGHGDSRRRRVKFLCPST